jgi:hypothetical protein
VFGSYADRFAMALFPEERGRPVLRRIDEVRDYSSTGRAWTDLDNGTFYGVEWRDGLPTRGVGQSCAVCDGRPSWLHPLRRDRASYADGGGTVTLPGFWTLCDRCEDLYARGRYADLVAVELTESPRWAETPPIDIGEQIGKHLRAFRAADLGARPLPP